MLSTPFNVAPGCLFPFYASLLRAWRAIGGSTPLFPIILLRHVLFGVSPDELLVVPRVFLYLLHKLKFLVWSQRKDFCFRFFFLSPSSSLSKPVCVFTSRYSSNVLSHPVASVIFFVSGAPLASFVLLVVGNLSSIFELLRAIGTFFAWP